MNKWTGMENGSWWRWGRGEGREPCEGRRITSAVIDYWLHYNESKQFGVILSQVAADTWQQWSARGEDKWITRHLARGRLEFRRGSHIMCGEPRKLTGCLRDGTGRHRLLLHDISGLNARKWNELLCRFYPQRCDAYYWSHLGLKNSYCY